MSPTVSAPSEGTGWRQSGQRTSARATASYAASFLPQGVQISFEQHARNEFSAIGRSSRQIGHGSLGTAPSASSGNAARPVVDADCDAGAVADADCDADCDADADAARDARRDAAHAAAWPARSAAWHGLEQYAAPHWHRSLVTLAHTMQLRGARACGGGGTHADRVPIGGGKGDDRSCDFFFFLCKTHGILCP